MEPFTEEIETDPDWPRRVGRAALFLALGLVGTAVAGLVFLRLTLVVQRVVYDLLYLQVGPSEATEAAILTHVLAAGLAAIGLATLAGDVLAGRDGDRTPVAKAVGLLSVLLIAFLAVSLLHLAAFLTALATLTVAAVAVPLALRYRWDASAGGVFAFLGGVPVLVALLLLAGFGLGWGWGYVLTAEQVPASTVEGPVTADFEEVPAVRDALFERGDCSTADEGARTCRLSLRGSTQEVPATRFMARHGVRCPYQNGAGAGGSFVARHDGTLYRVTCAPHGD